MMDKTICREASELGWVTLHISGTKCDPDNISQLLHLSPSEVTKVGDVIYQDDDRTIRSDQTFWQFSSQGKVPGTSATDHLKWTLGHLLGVIPGVRFLLDDGARFDLKAHVDAFEPVVGAVLDVEMIQQIAQLRIPLQYVVRYQNTKAPG